MVKPSRSFLAVALIAASCTAAFAGEITVTNESGHRLVRFYARNNNDPDNLRHRYFEANPIDDGDSRTFHVPTGGDCRDWNIEVDRPPNHVTKLMSISLCGSHEWTVDEDNLDNSDGSWNNWGNSEPQE